MNRQPTLKEKVKMYEQFLHDVQMYSVCGRGDLIQVLVDNACSWSYAHRVGNGEYSDKEQNKIVTTNFWKLTTVPDVLK
jgi:hypothetical protein